MKGLRGSRRAVAGLACALVLTGCSTFEGTGDKGYVSGDGRVTQVAAVDRGEPIVLEGEDLEGQPLDLADYRGKPVVVNVWGSWCAACRIETPDLLEAEEELEGVAEFVGINSRDTSTAQALSYERRAGITFPSFYSPTGEAALAFPQLAIATVPATIVLDAEGRVAATIPGGLPSAQTLVDVVEDAAGSTDG
ncbi:TlpA disulfide reductase family protein [Nocardioides bigeumensis]|uniref:TlpA disulfide reductase family protein n=1 Tax=Nocardioides bigeumensis TaxID=433657 RepID=A0ABP5KEC7_9ACTN